MPYRIFSERIDRGQLPFDPPPPESSVWNDAVVRPPGTEDYPIFVDARRYAQERQIPGGHYYTYQTKGRDLAVFPWMRGTLWCRATPPKEPTGRGLVPELQRKIARQSRALAELHREVTELKQTLAAVRAAVC